MRLIFLTLFVFAICRSQTFANEGEPHDWLEMSDACEAAVFEQDTTFFDGLTAATPLIGVEGLEEVSVSHPSSSLVASYVSDGSQIFLCIVDSVPRLDRNMGRVVGHWAGRQFARYNQNPNYEAVVFDDGNTFAPILVRCGADGRLAVVHAFVIEGAFRIGVTNRLPASVRNPCAK